MQRRTVRFESSMQPRLTPLRIIREMLLDVWGITEPRPFQVAAIRVLALGGRLLLVQRTGSGESLVLYGAATLLRDITISR